MLVTLERVGWSDYRPWKAKPGNKAGSLAWCDPKTATVYCRRGVATLSRLGHELEHLLDPKFRNENHHPWFHFCIRSYGPFRQWRHQKKVAKPFARELQRTAKLSVFTT